MIMIHFVFILLCCNNIMMKVIVHVHYICVCENKHVSKGEGRLWMRILFKEIEPWCELNFLSQFIAWNFHF